MIYMTVVFLGLAGFYSNYLFEFMEIQFGNQFNWKLLIEEDKILK